MHIEVSEPRRRRLISCGWLLSVLLLCAWFPASFAMEAAEAQRLLAEADRIKLGRSGDFDALLDRVTDKARDLPAPQRDYLRYLRGYQASYQGKLDVAVSLLESLIQDTDDPTLKFRSAATIANVHVIATRYELAYAQLRPLLDLLPRVSDPAARQQGMAVAAYLYNQVGEYGLGLSYADRIIEENWGNGACRGAQLRMEALYRSGTVEPTDPEFATSADRCIAMGEPLIASGILVHFSRLLLDKGKIDEALQVLTGNYEAVLQTRYPRVIGEYNALLARAYLSKGDTARAREHARKTIDLGVRGQATEPLVMAYQTLYQIARATGDERAALDYHEKFAAADKGYLDELSARQLAYERIKHETEQQRLKTDTQRKDDRLTDLQKELDEKNAEATWLHVALGIMMLALITLLYRRRATR